MKTGTLMPPRIADIRDQPVYDTVYYRPEGPFELFWFVEPQGTTSTLLVNGVPGTVCKSLTETNLGMTGVSTRALDIRALSVLPIPGGTFPLSARHHDVIRLVESAVFELRVGDKLRLTIDLASLLPDWWNAESFLRLRRWVEGLPENMWEGYRFRLDEPIIIPAMVNFMARAMWRGSPYFHGGCNLRLRLHGFQGTMIPQQATHAGAGAA